MRTAQVSRSGACSPGFDFWHASGLGILLQLRPMAHCRWTWPVGGTVSISPDQWLGGLAGPREQDIDPEVDSLGSMGNWIKVPREESGDLETTMEVKKMHVFRKAILAAACTAGLAVAATPGFAQ